MLPQCRRAAGASQGGVGAEFPGGPQARQPWRRGPGPLIYPCGLPFWLSRYRRRGHQDVTLEEAWVSPNKHTPPLVPRNQQAAMSAEPVVPHIPMRPCPHDLRLSLGMNLWSGRRHHPTAHLCMRLCVRALSRADANQLKCMQHAVHSSREVRALVRSCVLYF